MSAPSEEQATTIGFGPGRRRSCGVYPGAAGRLARAAPAGPAWWLLEVDMGTKTQTRWRRKLRGLLAWLHPGYTDSALAEISRSSPWWQSQ